MRIAILVYGLDRIGGIKKKAVNVSKALVNLGHDVDIYCMNYDRERCYPNMLKDFNVQSIRKDIFNYDNINTDQRPYGVRYLNYLLTLWRFYEDQKNLSLLIPHGYNIVIPVANMVNWAAAFYKERFGTPIIWLCDDFVPIASYRYKTYSSSREKLELCLKQFICFPFEIIDRRSVCSIDHIAVLSKRVKYQMKEHYGVNSHVIRNGVDVQTYAIGNGLKVRNSYGFHTSTFVLLTVCSLISRRRLEDVIQAIRILLDQGCDVSYLIVGRKCENLAYTKMLEEEVLTYGLSDHVYFVGEVSESELVDYYHSCDAFVWVADENQSWGLAGMEAMAAGKPIIVSLANGLSEILENEKTALVIEPRSPGAIAQAINLLHTNPELAARIASTGRKLVFEQYSWKKNAEQTLDLFYEGKKSC